MDRETAVRRLARADHLVDPLSRVGLGVVILLAGVHKLLAPEAWAVYLVPPFDRLVLVSPVEFMLVNGVLEPPFALALISDRYTTFAAAFVTVSLSVTVVYLAVAALLTNGAFVDVLIRDVGLAALAASVTLRAAGRAEG
ncbi:DoxX family protein [Salinigranum rubrum]|uniref:DoxX family protein n=1 Tax=Salinigranum rubrum TaxID=755307 RepID=A0A2I8VN35_9EURY|nr:DoxX family membrane protein [Salinigranum rubrum]AUV83350.1 DoxX family protein [Salinigranum rubrum]